MAKHCLAGLKHDNWSPDEHFVNNLFSDGEHCHGVGTDAMAQGTGASGMQVGISLNDASSLATDCLGPMSTSPGADPQPFDEHVALGSHEAPLGAYGFGEERTESGWSDAGTSSAAVSQEGDAGGPLGHNRASERVLAECIAQHVVIPIFKARSE